jgi:hypothetical protein
VPGPTADVKVDTQEVCAGIVAAYDVEKGELLAVLGDLFTASADEDEAALEAARAKSEVILSRLTEAVEAELSNAADPEAKAAIQEFVTTYAKLVTPEGLEDPAFEAKLDKAAAEAGKFCPALIE